MAESPPALAVAAAARRSFETAFQRTAAQVAIAPGRVNLIGEHTDYNDGFVLPMAIDRAVAIACRPRADRALCVHAAATGATAEIGLSPVTRRPTGWDAYVAGVAWAFERAGFTLSGADLAIASDLPMGAGLSSSAALELATARALSACSSIPWDPVRMARLACEAENEFVGVSCGIMDQFASALSENDCALLVDCRSLHTRPVPIPGGVSIVVMDTGVRRSLVTSAYNQRRAACGRAVEAAQRLDGRVRALRDVDASLLARACESMDDEACRRARHVVAEIPRPDALAACLAASDLTAAGALLNDSHASLRDLYDVSCPELDAIVSAAQAHPGCFGARLTGAGFGGCAVALVLPAAMHAFVAEVSARYRDATGRTSAIFSSAAVAGARLVRA